MAQVASLPAKRPRPALKTLDFWVQALAWSLVLLFIATFTWLAIERHRAFQSGFDLGVYNQVVWNTLHGRPFFYTSTGQPLLHLSNHADPILLLPAPFYLIYSGPETLLFLQAALIGLAGLPVFWLSREKLGSDLAAIGLLLAYLLFPGTETVTLSDFHPPVLACAFLMFAFYFLEKRRWGWFLLFCILAMACKEQIPLQVIFLGGYILIRYRHWRVGLAAVLLGAAWFGLVMYWIIPANSVTGSHLFLDYYAAFGDSPAQIVLTVLTRPDLVLQNLWQSAKLAFLRDVLAPFGFLPLVGLPILVIGAPSFAINLLSANPAQYDAARGHYVADVIPWVVWATLFGMIYLSQFLARRGPVRAASFNTVLGGGLIIVATGWHILYGFSPLALNRPHYEVTAHDRIGQRLLEQIPPDAPISAQIRLYAHLSHRHLAYVFPHIFEAEYIFLDVTADTSPLHPFNQRDEIRRLLDSGEFGVLDAADGFILLKRGLANPTLPDSFYNFARSEDTPQHVLNLTFGDELRLLGFDLIDDPRRQETSVRLYWQALRPIERDLRLYPFFVDAEGQVIEDTSLRPMATQIWYPPRKWSPGEVVVSQTLPWSLGDRWGLAAGVLAGDDWSQWNERLKATPGQGTTGLRRFETNTWVRLATFERQQGELVEIVPVDADLVPSNRLEANFDNKMHFLGYDVARSGADLNLTLYWETLAAMGYDYTIFAHLIDETDNQVVQQDAQPWWEVSIPTSTWQPGEKLRDRHTLTLPPDLPPGRYRLRIGVYYWQTLERLPVVENGTVVGDFVILGEVGE